ncbi:MAG: flagellar basal body rod C-terminal domain-containing protein, partial [Opitutales bacterium]
KWVGHDGVSNTQDDGRSLILGYEEMPFRMVQGENTFIFGDNFSFDALIKGHRNLAKALQLDDGFTFDNLVSTHTGEDGANEIALAIAEMGNGDFTEQVSVINTDVGRSLGDVVDNLEHQQMVEGMLVDERQSISAVSLDEEVSNLMRYQRAFQASARVVTTLDNMLELVVMGLIR